jgi:hypothetical protein
VLDNVDRDNDYRVETQYHHHQVIIGLEPPERAKGHAARNATIGDMLVFCIWAQVLVLRRAGFVHVG